MTEEEYDFYKYAAFHSVSEFSDLSIAEIIALEFLARYSKPIVRHTLYTEVKQLIEFKENSPFLKEKKKYDGTAEKFFDNVKDKKKLSTSSFYNSLTNLEQRGLITMDSNSKGKKTYIEPTQFTQFIPKLMLKFLINNNIMDSPEFRSEFSKEFSEIIKKHNFESILTLWLSEYEVFSIIQYISNFAKEIYILSKSISNNGEIAAKFNNIKYTEMMNKQISAPENVFDGVIIPIYKKNPKFYDMTRIEILREICRVSKPGGLVVLVAVTDIPLSENNVMMNELIKLYNIALNNRIFTERELEEEMKLVNLKEIRVIDHQGLLIGIGTNP